jgi:hypothetical protein
MSETARKDHAYPKSQVQTPRFIIFRFCGGSGGGDCPVLLGDTQFVYPIRVPKHLVFNKSLLLNNPEFLGVDIFGNAGAVGFCNPASDSVRKPWWLAFSDDGVLSVGEIMANGIYINQAPPFEIEVDASKLPQPVLLGGGANPDWEQRIYVHIYWGDPSYVTFSGYLANRDERVLEVVKHNYDIKL